LYVSVLFQPFVVFPLASDNFGITAFGKVMTQRFCFVTGLQSESCVADLLAKVDPVAFTTKFGVDLGEAQTLIEAKTLTISKLMTIMPPGEAVATLPWKFIVKVGGYSPSTVRMAKSKILTFRC
jgi:hypothetical protein